MSSKNKIVKSFSFAFNGIKEVLRNEPNFKIHLILAAAAIITAYLLRLSRIEWLILFLTIGLVLILELVNTSVEAIVDLISPEIRDQAKVAKDVCAASVLVSAILSIVVGAFLFLPRLFQLLVP